MLATELRRADLREIDQVQLAAQITEILNQHPAVGLAIGVVNDGNLVFFKGHGVAGIALKTPITEDTVFRIASISKTFTTVAVMQLWERGRSISMLLRTSTCMHSS